MTHVDGVAARDLGAAMSGAADARSIVQGRGPREDFEGEGWPKPAGKTVSEFAEDMSVNHVVRLYPVTRSAFERLGVSLQWEGLDSLDEVAWHHGLENRELLGRLQEELHTGTGAPEGAQPVEHPGFQASPRVPDCGGRITRDVPPDARPIRFQQSLQFI